VEKISSKPSGFDDGTSSPFFNNPALQPQWGTCPSPTTD